MNKKLYIYADGIPPDIDYINKIIDEYNIVGFTCNPTLIKNYLPITYYDYCKIILDNSRNFPVSIQVLSSNLDEMIKEAEIISSWGNNVYVKIPIINEYEESCIPVIKKLLEKKLKVNITAIFKYEQIVPLYYANEIPERSDYILSFFSGRVSDMGIPPNHLLESIYTAMKTLKGNYRGKILWAGARQVTDIDNAKKYCDIITIPKSVIDKLDCKKKTLSEYCAETVQMFARDSKNFTL